MKVRMMIVVFGVSLMVGFIGSKSSLANGPVVKSMTECGTHGWIDDSKYHPCFNNYRPGALAPVRSGYGYDMPREQQSLYEYRNRNGRNNNIAPAFILGAAIIVADSLLNNRHHRGNHRGGHRQYYGYSKKKYACSSRHRMLYFNDLGLHNRSYHPRKFRWW